MKFHCLLAAIVVYSTTASAGLKRTWKTWELPVFYHPHHHQECVHDGAYPTEPHADTFHARQVCSCIRYVGDTEVFRRHDNGWYPCNGWGLYRCEQFCTELFQDENIRYRSRQGACDVLNREISTLWYRRDQVCGIRGPYQDRPLQVDLCCRRGRPSQECQETS